jgi:hypothetical protein
MSIDLWLLQGTDSFTPYNYFFLVAIVEVKQNEKGVSNMSSKDTDGIGNLGMTNRSTPRHRDATQKQ